MKKFQNPNITLVSGPTRGGKSIWAEYLTKNDPNITYIATSELHTNDQSWQERIELHRKRRPKYWSVLESPDDLSHSISAIDTHETILIDSLGGFVSKYIVNNDDYWQHISDEFIDSLVYREGQSIIVIEEIGWGVVPITKIGNLFTDRMGFLTQKLERISSNSWLVIHGRALDLKKFGIEVP